MRTSEPPGQGVLDRVFRLLNAFSDGSPDLTLSELRARSGLSRSTAHRLATQLCEYGVLERSVSGWRLGTRLFELGQLVPREHGLRELALAHMQDLYAATGETVQLAVIDAEQVLYVEIISGHRKVPTPSRRGGRMPLHCTALGKVLLAFSADGGRSFLDRAARFERRTRHTLIDPESLLSELHEVRHTRLAYDREEAAVGLQCVAAPILDRSGNASSALSVSMPVTGSLTLGEAASALRAVASAVSRAGLVV